VAADSFTKSDALGHGQHGGLGRYETRPCLVVSGPGVRAGVCERPTRAVDIAPTILDFLGVARGGTDGAVLPLR
jgi:arylsulfatase A-like enzyme